jgi:hypothetical protein
VVVNQHHKGSEVEQEGPGASPLAEELQERPNGSWDLVCMCAIRGVGRAVCEHRHTVARGLYLAPRWELDMLDMRGLGRSAGETNAPVSRSTHC